MPVPTSRNFQTRSQKLKTILKGGIKRCLDVAVGSMGKTSVGRYVYGQIVVNAMCRTQKVRHRDLDLLFSIPNSLTKFRADTFSTKEPETLEWIDGMPEGSVLWDIGANVGLYSCYAAKACRCRVYAFEPSVFNLELLARNIFLNKLTGLVTIIPLALSEALTVSKLNMTSTEWGGAESTFDNPYGYDGQPISATFDFSTIGLSMNEAIEVLRIPKPDYIKMDVDGIEHLILKGGTAVLQNVQGVLIEINDEFQQQSEEATRCLRAAGLHFTEKRRWEKSVGTPAGSTYNQIWHRDHAL